MIGAGVFSVWGPAAAAAGPALLIALALALVVAACNAASTAQLASQYPTSGGAYVFGRERLGEWWGFVAGWGFVTGKSASAAAMALTFAAYIAPASWMRPVAFAALVALIVLSSFGITRTAAAARVLVALVLIGLAVLIVAAWLVAADEPTGAAQWFVGLDTALAQPRGWLGILQGAGLLFFAFAGYARVATLGEEVRDPTRTIPRAMLITFAVVAAIYALVAVTLLAVLGPGGIALSLAPLADAVAPLGWAGPIVAITAALAALGALLAAIAGITRTALAMAREGDLPQPLATVHPVRRVPQVATWTLGAVVAALLVIGDIRQVIGFSSAGVLTYYFVANVAAFTQSGEHRRLPRWVHVLGAALCALLVGTLPWQAVAGSAAIFAVGLIGRAIALRRARA